MPRKLPPMNAVRAFEAAARHVSFTKAAVELNVTHGAVSRQVSQLESWLGVPLFKRSASQLALTEPARAYSVEVTSMLDRLAVASGQLKEQATPRSLTVNAPPTFTMRWLLPRLSTFQRLRSDVEIKLTTSVAPVNFQENPYDVAIRGARAPLAGCRSQSVMTELIVPVCHVDLAERGRLANARNLRQQTLIHYTTEPCSWAQWLTAVGLEGLQSEHQLHFEQMFFALQAAAEGLGVVLVPFFLVLDDIVGGRLCAPFGLMGAQQRQYYANSSIASPKRVVIEAFSDWLLREGRDTEASIAAWAQVHDIARIKPAD
jgi:LysR family glycine cleavage system transcriptional activator